MHVELQNRGTALRAHDNLSAGSWPVRRHATSVLLHGAVDRDGGTTTPVREGATGSRRQCMATHVCAPGLAVGCGPGGVVPEGGRDPFYPGASSRPRLNVGGVATRQ
jgi:hypothetical protein